MDIIVESLEGRGLPPYPYRKVVFVADQAEVAELPSEGVETENVVFHADLFERLVGKHPDLAEAMGTSRFAGWLTEAGDEAVLHLAPTGGITNEIAEGLGRALSDWCSASRIARLTIGGSSQRIGREADSDDDWNVFL